MENRLIPAQQQRIGFHYFPDTVHYRNLDLMRWLPEMQSFGAAWVTLYAQDDHAIPEPFISGLIKANIKPVVHIHASISTPPRIDSLKALLTAYANWGVQHVVLFDRPNLLSSWSTTGWVHSKLIDRFLDLYLPFAEIALSQNLMPILPPLEPGGNFWDTAFLRDVLIALERRGYSLLLERMILGAYARFGNRPLNWGAGGPERWPSAKPYHTPVGSQDQRGYRIFDWYLTISNAMTGKSMPIMLFEVGCCPGEISDPNYPSITIETHAERYIEIASSLIGQSTELEGTPNEVLACNFWPICSAIGHPEASYAWFQANGDRLPVVDSMKSWALSNQPINMAASARPTKSLNSHPIAHYLLVNEDHWGKQGKSSLVLQNFMQKYKPAIGFSTSEAAFARRVTIFGSSKIFPDTIVDQLITAGCQVERIQEDGTVIASTSLEV